MPAFYLPYHFVPVKPRTKEQKAQDVEVSRLRETARLGHHHYAPGTFSGRILCKLVNETPLCIGAERHGDTTPATVDPFEIGGRPAIPGSSLRGLLSSIAEAASGSAARILDDGVYSYRREVSEALHAIGMMVEVRNEDGSVAETEDGQRIFRLRPLALPLLRTGEPGGPGKIPSEFVPLFARGEAPYAPLKVFLGDRWNIRDESFRFRTFHREAPAYYGLRLHRPTLSPSGGWHLPATAPGQDRREGKYEDFVLGQKPNGASKPKLWEEIEAAQRPQYTKGIVRVLGVWDRADIPSTKKHELFLPLPPGVESVDDLPAFEVLPSAVQRFHELADQRTAARKEDDGPSLPYEPRDTPRNLEAKDPTDRRFRLKDGDLVYFRPTADGRAIAEVSLSAIWRGRVETESGTGEVEGASARTFFASVDEDLVPFHRGRTRVTPAEQLFGFVSSDQAAGEAGTAPVQGLAGRLRFSDGHLVGPADGKEPYLEEVSLKVLATPKPPSPALYFRPKGRKGYIEKKTLRPGSHHPQGRKMYLHHQPAGGQDPPWATAQEEERATMISRIRPLRWKREFLFSIDVHNLSPEDFGLLVYSLRPTEDFRHKLGMGKPLGLGTVRIEPLAVLRIDRRRRYSGDGFLGPRYHEGWQADGLDLQELGEAGFELEAEYLESMRSEEAEPGSGPTDGPFDLDFFQAREACRDHLDPDLGGALELLGERRLPGVRQPLVDGQTDAETETYKWFVANDVGSGKGQGNKIPAQNQSLEPLDVWLARQRREGVFPQLEDNPWRGD